MSLILYGIGSISSGFRVVDNWDRIPRTSTEGSMTRIGIGSAGSEGGRMSLGIELAVWQRTSPP